MGNVPIPIQWLQRNRALDTGGVPFFQVDGALVVASQVGTYVVPKNGTITAVYVYCKDKGTSGSTTVDIHRNGTTIFTTQSNRPSLAYNDADSVAKSGTPDITSIAENDVLTIDIDAIAVGAANLCVVLDIPSGGAPASSSSGAVMHNEIITFSFDGQQGVEAGTLRWYNKWGTTITITRIFIGANTAPVGAAIIVDVNKNGTTIFTNQAHRPQIADGANTGVTTDIDVNTLTDVDYLTVDRDQVGSSSKGMDLVVEIVVLVPSPS